MKRSLVAIKEVLLYIINNSMRLALFSSQLKLTRIKLIYKNKRNPESFENEMPISLLLTF